MINLTIKMGHYYKIDRRPYRASLCIFCNSRHVTNYRTCLLKGMGMIVKDGHELLGCIAYEDIKEITEEEYNLLRIEQAIEEAL